MLSGVDTEPSAGENVCMGDTPGLTDSSGTPIPASLEGYFLVSETELSDPNFERTVVLMITHNDEGAFGLVVNRPAGIQIGEVIEEFDGRPAGEIEAYVGGPVEQHYLFTLHSGVPAEAMSAYATEPTSGVVFEPVFHAMEGYLLSDWENLPPGSRPSITCFLGYAGWGPGQLETELAQNAWLVIPATPEIVFFENPEEGWNAALRQKGGLYEIIAKTGFKPSMN
jgi:putative transcriptional regulator